MHSSWAGHQETGAARGQQGGGRHDGPVIRDADVRRVWGVMIPEEWLVMGDGDGGKATEINRWKSLAALEGLSPFQIEIIEG